MLVGMSCSGAANEGIAVVCVGLGLFNSIESCKGQPLCSCHVCLGEGLDTALSEGRYWQIASNLACPLQHSHGIQIRSGLVAHMSFRFALLHPSFL